MLVSPCSGIEAKVSDYSRQCFLKIANLGALWSGAFQPVHDEETSGHPTLCTLTLADFFAIGYRSMADVLVKKAAEGSEALKTYFEANIRYANIIRAKQLLCFFDATLNEVLMRCLVKRLSKKPEKVITRETCFTRDLVEAQRMVVTMIDKLTRSGKPLQDVGLETQGFFVHRAQITHVAQIK
jgi:hypothetical protein